MDDTNQLNQRHSKGSSSFFELIESLSVPAMQAPMFLITGTEMVINACKSGVIGCFPAPNARTIDVFEQWLSEIKNELAPDKAAAPWAVNLIMHPTYPRREEEMALVLKYQPPIVVTALGSPARIVEHVHSYGGIVIADVSSPRMAKKAADAGVDGLVLLSVGAGGHTGYLSPFAFVQEVRQWWNGLLILAGGINSGKSVHAAKVLGADLAYLGTHFIATKESLCQDDYKDMVVDSSADDIVTSAAITGVKANWMRQSLLNAGFDPDDMGDKSSIDFAENGAQNKRWKDIWAAGQGVGGVDSIQSVAQVINKLSQEYRASRECN